jgi:hypothetical protein
MPRPIEIGLQDHSPGHHKPILTAGDNKHLDILNKFKAAFHEEF